MLILGKLQGRLHSRWNVLSERRSSIQNFEFTLCRPKSLVIDVSLLGSSRAPGGELADDIVPRSVAVQNALFRIGPYLGNAAISSET